MEERVVQEEEEAIDVANRTALQSFRTAPEILQAPGGREKRSSKQLINSVVPLKERK